LSALIGSLGVNVTYYAHVNAIVSGVPSSYTAPVATATLANVPAVAVATWTAVSQQSLVVNWTANGNPAGTTFVVDLSTGAFPNSFTGNASTATITPAASFGGLTPDATYFAQVKAVNFSGISTAYAMLGSTKTLAPNAPANLRYVQNR
jgi:hypothetical protein